MIKNQDQNNTSSTHIVANAQMFWKGRRITAPESVNTTTTATKTNSGISVILKILPHHQITTIDFVQVKKPLFSQILNSIQISYQIFLVQPHQFKSLIYRFIKFRHNEFKIFYFLFMLFIKLSSFEKILKSKWKLKCSSTNITKKINKVETIFIEQKISNSQMIKQVITSFRIQHRASLPCSRVVNNLFNHFLFKFQYTIGLFQYFWYILKQNSQRPCSFFRIFIKYLTYSNLDQFHILLARAVILLIVIIDDILYIGISLQYIFILLLSHQLPGMEYLQVRYCFIGNIVVFCHRNPHTLIRRVLLFSIEYNGSSALSLYSQNILNLSLNFLTFFYIITLNHYQN